jgi:serine/threonine-protein kinase RsbW
MDKNLKIKKMVVGNQIDELNKVAFYLENLGEEWGLPSPLIISLNLVMEEALSNIILYGFDASSRHTIEVDIQKTDEKITFSIVDDGRAYDPTLKHDPDITLSAENRPIGGLGIFLIKKIMDEVEYQRHDNRNYLILTKNIES